MDIVHAQNHQDDKKGRMHLSSCQILYTCGISACLKVLYCVDENKEKNKVQEGITSLEEINRVTIE